jgi:5'-3' exonuclease
VRQPQERRPLLVIDGDSFAYRAHHALLKSIRRKGDKPAVRILGFANFLLRLYREEQPRAVPGPKAGKSFHAVIVWGVGDATHKAA